MYSIKFSQSTITTIRMFVKNFHKKNIDTISGGGILGEEDMIQTYIIGAKALREKIFLTCESGLSPEVVAKRMYSENQYLCSIFNMGNIRLFVFYSEDVEEKIRYIHSIELLRK